MSPLLAKHGLCILPRMISRHCDERQSKNGGQIFYVTVEAEFDFVATSDGSTHVVRTFGEAMDSADKATNKAMSAAYKYAAFQAFAIPTEGDNDADAHTPDPGIKKNTPPAAQKKNREITVSEYNNLLSKAAESQGKEFAPYSSVKEIPEHLKAWADSKLAA